MFIYKRKSSEVSNLIFKKKFFVKKEKKKLYYAIIRSNKRQSLLLHYKLKIKNKNYQSICKQTNVCFKTGRHRSVVQEFNFKRQMYKKFLNKNFGSFLKKKFN